MFYNKLNVLLCMIYMFTPVVSQLEQCYADYELFEDLRNIRFASMNYSPVMFSTEMPTKEHMRINSIDAVYRSDTTVALRLMLKDMAQQNKSFFVGLVIKKFEEDGRDDSKQVAENEVTLAKKLSKNQPLAFPRFLSCAYEGSGRLYMLMEILDPSLGSDEFMVSKHGTKIREYLINLLLMSKSLLALHLEGYAHNNINPNNFAFTGKETKTIKLFDFGRTGVPDEDASALFNSDDFKNNLLFVDPVIFETEKTSRWNDTYSLGMTMFYILYVRVEPVTNKQGKFIKTNRDLGFQVPDPLIITNSDYRDNYYLGKDKAIQDRIAENKENCHTKHGGEACSENDLLNDTISQLLKPNLNERLRLDHAVNKLEEFFRELDSSSIYLSENVDALYTAMYSNKYYEKERYTYQPEMEPWTYKQHVIENNKPEPTVSALDKLSGIFSFRAKKKEAEPVVLEPEPVDNIEVVLPATSKEYLSSVLGADYAGFTSPYLTEINLRRKIIL